LQDTLKDIADYQEWTSDLSHLSSGQWVHQNDLSSLIASKHLWKVLAVRVVIFQLFLWLTIMVDRKLQEKHKHIWLLFQLSNQLPCGGILHPFVHIIKKCLHSRWATRLYPHSFISSTMVSGTGLLLAELEEAMAFRVSKPGAVILFHWLGMFDTWPKLKPFLEHYIPASILEIPSGYHLQIWIWEYLLGQYCFSVSFLELFLRNGLESPHKLLNEYIKEHTICLPGNTGDPFTSSEPELQCEVQATSFEWDRLKLDLTTLQETVQIVQSHLTKGKSLTFGPITDFTIFNFHNTPVWVNDMVQIIGHLNGIDVAVDILGGEPGTYHYSPLFGPDIIIWCSSPLSNLTITSSNILAMGQFKSYTGVHWFKQIPLHQHQKLINAIEKYCVLCFVGGYPLPPNLNLSAISVRQAIDALGPNIALASINLDTFKAHFISEDEARNVLALLEDALTHKRKINEIDS
ncbi:hypothetical protein L208DRAFT_1387485, partial [Tricholoma matsutake]